MDMVKTGPMGGETTEGTVWDEKGKGDIAKIFVTTGLDFVLSLQFLFVDANGQFVLSQKHGVQSNFSFATTFYTVVLDYPSEFLVGIKGTNGLRSVTFLTNKGTYGSTKPMIVDNLFEIQIGNDRSFGGFHGIQHETYIVSIGLYLKPITPSMNKPTPVSRPTPVTTAQRRKTK